MGSHDRDVILSTEGRGETFDEIVERRLSRRAFLKGIAASAVVVGASVGGSAATAEAQEGKLALSFSPIPPSQGASESLAAGHVEEVLLRWGDPILAGAPAHDLNNQTAAAQEGQFGYNCDFVGFLPVPYGSGRSDLGLLVVNHEYTNPELMFAGYNPNSPTKEQVDVELAAHGMSVVQVRWDGGRWVYDQGAGANRRLTALTRMELTGPAAGHDWFKTAEDSEGRFVSGTLNNCAGGKTPWGTVVSGEENFNQYFANLSSLPADDPRRAIHNRYGLTSGASERKWERFYDRFDIAKEPNEPFRFGWCVEVDPYDPNSTPKKRTALGRAKHEAATFTVAANGRVVAYSGDDERFDYIYKFVTAGTFNPNDRAANLDLLDEGTLYVAKLNDDGTGVWLPLVYGQGPLTDANGYSSQANVLIRTRQAADLLGATKMDRPEDVEVNPVNKKIYAVLTNNNQRGTANRPGTDKANPRADNRSGHIIEITEAGNDHTATTFTWDIFLLAGDPKDNTTYFAGFPKDKVSPIAAPDNIAFDNAGNLWIATDGQAAAIKNNDGFYAVPVEGPERGYLRQFYATVTGAEVCGPEFTPDNKTLFLAIQHPGEGGTFEKPVSSWPAAAGAPRPSVIAIRSTSGMPIGMGLASTTPAAGAPAAPSQPASGDTTRVPVSLPNTGAESSFPSALAAAGALAAAAAGAILRRRSQSTQSNEEAAEGSEQ
ncbi:MAG TPA: PhoX family phosphatase [Roseiflexaceae bacterium]|nr:PhoX family phosphatase [Roseiflexaceae bacterium]